MLNAAYLLARLREGRAAGTADRLRPRPHARVRALRCCRKRELGTKTLVVAKLLLDFGYDPPTIYFPLLVDEALMFEPTETETRESLDALAGAIDAILEEAERDPEIARDAGQPPAPVRRLDKARPSRRPVVRQAL